MCHNVVLSRMICILLERALKLKMLSLTTISAHLPARSDHTDLIFWLQGPRPRGFQKSLSYVVFWAPKLVSERMASRVIFLNRGIASNAPPPAYILRELWSEGEFVFVLFMFGGVGELPHGSFSQLQIDFILELSSGFCWIARCGLLRGMLD